MSAYLLQWGLLTGNLPGADDGVGFAVLWAGYGIIAGIGSAILGARVKQKPGKSAIGVRAESAIWRGVGIGVGTVAIACIVRMFVDHDVHAPNYIMGPAFAMFGAALMATGMMSGQKWLTPFAVLAFVTAVAVGVFANAVWVYLLGAGASVLVLAIPGIALLRREPSALV